MTEDFYEVLGVGREASAEEITSAYREKATEYHPDVSDDPDAEEKFKNVKKAHEVLTDDEKRQAYDRLGHDRFLEAEKHGGFDGGAGGAGGQGPFGGMGRGQRRGQGQDPFGGMGDIFEQFFGGGDSRGRSRDRGGADLRTELAIDLEDVYRGVTKRVTVTRPERCPDCGGAGHPAEASARTCPQCDGRGQETTVQQTPLGRVQQTRTCRRCSGSGEVYSETCRECSGEGRVRRETTLEVDVPAGIQDGQTLRMDGEGAPAPGGGRDGDLLIEVAIRDHPEFERDEDDLYRGAAVSFPQAVFGDTIEVETLGDTVDLEIPAGTQSSEQFRLAGEGVPHLRRRGSGDLYVQVQVVVPESLNEEQREALEAFAAAGGEEIEVEQGFFERIRNSL